LRNVEPPEARSGIVVGRDVFLAPPKVAEFDIYQCLLVDVRQRLFKIMASYTCRMVHTSRWNIARQVP
jgi:hypothetical protein